MRFLRGWRQWLLAALVIAVAGCTAQRPRPLDDDVTPDAVAGHGFALLSVTKNAGSNAWILFRPLGGEALPLDAQGHSFWNRRNDFPASDGQAGQLMFIRLPEGHYELTNWRLRSHSGLHRNRDLGPAYLPPIGFFVREGEVVYLGNFHVNVDYALSDTLPEHLQPIQSAGLAIKDESERDLFVFRDRYQAFAGKPVRMSVKSRPEWDVRIEGH